MKPKSTTMLHWTKVENTYQDPKYKLEIKEYIIKTNILVSQTYWLKNVGGGGRHEPIVEGTLSPGVF